MKVTDLTLFAPDVTSISIACLILKELTLTSVRDNELYLKAL